MTNTKLFLEILREKRITQAELAKRANMSRQSLSLKIHNAREFVPSQIEKICEILEINDISIRDALFFAA